MVPTGREKSATALKLGASRSGCAPGWRGGELLRLSHDVGLLPRSSARLFLPAKRLDLSGANCEPFGGSRRGGEHRLKSVPLRKELDVV